ncbi:hypothetical protein [Bradyrhizobium liaoningense]|uniref:hypothetical protein n=1 Tax=Bradyrhizobium liaoningense TaxID=43992 RepID=UPI001BA62EDF|nr:hypothetical protein [Bradyrhizobium liaoningense]MBR1070016.1 hypothetical protein [Bradyrhizobium liaoningense]
MKYDVLKPFNSTNRRFKPDVEGANTVEDTDDVSPHTIETLERREFIKALTAKPPVAPPENKMVAAPAVAGSEK